VSDRLEINTVGGPILATRARGEWGGVTLGEIHQLGNALAREGIHPHRMNLTVELQAEQWDELVNKIFEWRGAARQVLKETWCPHGADPAFCWLCRLPEGGGHA